MGEHAGDLPPSVPIDAVAHAVLEAARAARIGVTLTLVEPPAPRCIYINDAGAKTVGVPAQERLKGDALRVVAPEDVRPLRQRLRRRAEGEKGDKSYELDLVRRDGQRV